MPKIRVITAPTIDNQFSGVTCIDSELTFKSNWSDPDTPLLIFADAKFGAASVINHGGIVGSGLPIEALFWGDWWQTPEGVDRQVLISSRLQSVIASPYFSELQRSGVAAPHWRGARVVTRPSPPGAFNSTDDEQAVLDLIDALIDDDVFPDPDDEQIAQLVFMPKGFIDTIGANGAHTKDFNADGPFDRDYFWVAWVRWFDDYQYSNPSIPD
jgi:hypothetical protein